MAPKRFYIFRNRIRNLIRYKFQVPTQQIVYSQRARLECKTDELGQFVWRRLLPIVGTNPFPPHELMLMGTAMLWLRPEIVVEWGTNIGVSARVFHEINERYKIGAEIHSIDLPSSSSHDEHPKNMRGILVGNLPVVLHQGDGATVAASLLREKSYRKSMVLIDGDHGYESVLRDAQMILDVAPDTALLFHDTFYQPGSAYNHGPFEAVQKILTNLNRPAQVVESGLGCPGMTLILPLSHSCADRRSMNSTADSMINQVKR